MPSPSLADYAAYRERHLRDRTAPIVSVVTVTLNSAATLERTFRSVRSQTFSPIEHIIVDGDSSDATVDIIRRWVRPQDYWISECDRGISDAFNKGVAMARGSYIQILNADDWLSQDQIAAAMRGLAESPDDFVFGDVIFYDGDKPLFTWAGDPDYARVIHRRMPAIGHVTVLAARSCFERAGLFDVSYRRAMDYDWFLRLHRAGAKGLYCSAVVGHMTYTGVSNREFGETIEEVRRIAVAHGRSRLVAAAEARVRHLKTTAAQPLKRRVPPLYRVVRGLINPSFRPAPIDR